MKVVIYNSILFAFCLILLAGCNFNSVLDSTAPESIAAIGPPDKSAETTVLLSPEITERPSIIPNPSPTLLKDMVPFPEGYQVNNKDTADKLITQEYSLSELTEFFGMDEYSNGGYYTYIHNNYSVDEVNEKFKVECTRQNGYAFYTVFKVKEGGRYFVFWLTDYKEKYHFSYTADYIFDIKSEDDFKALKRWESTYNDVIAIDPSTELFLGYSDRIGLYSLLDNGYILEVEYPWEGKFNGDNLIIDRINVSEYGGDLSYIFKCDLEF